MKDLDILISALQEAGISIRVDEAGNLVVKAPPGAMTADLSFEIKSNKTRLLDFLSAAESSRKRQRNRIDKRIDADRSQLSDAQKRLWFLHLLDNKSTAYNMPLAVQIVGDIEFDRLEKALQEVAYRHESLRTRFEGHGGAVQAIVDSTPQLKLELLANSKLPQDINEQIRHSTQTATEHHFQLTKEHGIKAWLQPLNDGSHLLMVTLHHIVADGWSLANLISEFSQRYENPTATIPDLPIQYADYVGWLTNNHSAIERSLDWWRHTMAGAPEKTPLAYDHARPSVATYEGSELFETIPNKTIEAIKNLALETESTPYIVLLSAFALFIQKAANTDQVDEIVLGTTVANRDLPELEPLIGLFINMLPLRLAPSKPESVLDLIAHVKAVFLSAHEHRDVAFEQIVEAINPPRALNHSPLFQITFDVQNQPAADLTLGSNRLHPITPTINNSKFDLSVTVEVSENNPSVQWVWNTSIFDKRTIENWAKNFNHFLDQFGQAARQAPDRISSLAPQLELEWVNVQKANCKSKDLPNWIAMFETNVANRGNAIAVKDEVRTFSYAELRDRAQQIARELIESGVEPGDRVIVLKHRDVDLVACLMAAHYAGATYIPLDPYYPEERLAWVVEDSDPRVILTERNLASQPSISTREVLVLEDLSERPLTHFLPGPNQAQSAYIIFTSGSTGRPKGVSIGHLALTNFLCSMAREPQLDQHDNLLAVTTISFDIAVLELFLPLFVGGTTTIASHLSAIDGRALINLVEKERITCIQATPSTWRLMLDAGWRSAKNFKALCGGEALPSGLAQEITSTGATLWNMYGPTETTIWSAARKVTEEASASASGNESLGNGIDNTLLYVLDSSFNLVGTGCIGELWIGGVGLAQGYWQQPLQTAERYRPDPFSDEPGARMYGTGDLVRIRPDQHLDFLGRIDNQVKLRGFRIELGDIESALLQHPQVIAAAVTAEGSTPESQQLIAYVQSEADEESIRSILRERLPGYMLPSIIISIPKFPLTPNGKIDRRALSAFKKALPKPVQSRTPKTQVQLLLTEIWGEFLELESVDIATNVFELGAHSLMLSQVQQRLADTLEKPIELIDLFRYPTIQALSDFLDQQPRKISSRSLIAKTTSSEIAIIGAAAILPGAPDIDAFWDLLKKGGSGIQRFTIEQLRDAGFEDTLVTNPAFVPAHGAISDIDFFDAGYFGISPSEARLIDPQQRLFMQNAVHALQNAGYARFDNPQNIGVFAGSGQNDYLINNVLPFLDTSGSADSYDAIIASEKDFLTTRLSYLLNLTGPSLNIQTACSTGLVAVHAACQALRSGDCEMALAGAVALRIPQVNGHLYQENMIVSPDGNCRPFDQQANGTVWGSGVVAFILKPLDQAIADCDQVMSVIRGSAINNDGATKVGFTAPSVEGQTRVIQSAFADASVNPSDIQYIETHGTATALGDMIEFGALKDIWHDQDSTCFLGAIKSQIGHLNSAAGAAGLLKVVLALKHQNIPPSPYFQSPHEKLDRFNDHFKISSRLTAWPDNKARKTASVSSFGIGGTNAHLVLSDGPETNAAAPPDLSPHVLTLSAKSETALNSLCQVAADQWLKNDQSARDTAWTLIEGTSPMKYRAAIVATQLGETELIKNNVLSLRGQTASCKPTIGFLFPGQGAQSSGMAKTLYDRYTVFRETMDEMAGVIDAVLGIDLISLCCQERSEVKTKCLEETWVTQPALFATEYALASLWTSWGVIPQVMIGHSLGEITAACLAGVFDLKTALDLSIQRGKICWEQERGSMISVASSRVAISPLLVDHPEVDIAAINSPSSTVLAGEFNSIESLICDLTTASIRFKRLAVSHPFHSRFMKPGVKKLADFLSTKDLNPPNLDIISCFTGSKLEATQAVDPGFWANQLVMPVQFDSALKFLTRENALHLLEVGPGKTLSQLATDQSPSSNTIITSGTAEEKTLLEAAGRLWCHGVEIAIGKTLETPSPAPFQRTSIPPYPFEKTRFWLTPGHDLKSEHLPVDQWFSASEWERTPSKESDPLSPDAVWLLSGSIDSQLLEILSALDIKNDRSKTLSSNLTPTGVVVILSEENGLSPVVQARDILVDIYSRYPREKIKIRFIGAPKQPAKLSESYQVSLSMMKGLILVARQEMPSLELGCIEIDDYSLLSGADFLADITSTSPDLFVAYRQGERFTHRFSSIKLPAPVGHPKMLQQDGLYLISGGTGRLGYLLANYLNQRVNARCILLGRTIPKSMPTHLQDFCEFQQCDVGLEQDVNRVAKTLANRKLVVNGIIHAAGNPNLIASVEETPADWPWPSICTKVEGARNLGKHFGSQSDWGLMISSLASQLGGLGYSEYAVANAGLDAVAIEITKKFRKPWITVNFDAIAFDDSHPSNWISMQELPLVLNRIFNVSSLHQVTVSTTPVEKRLAFFSDATDEVTQELTIVNRKGLSSTESMITSIWEQLLGYDNISLDDDYFDLGGDSLKAIRIIEALREQLNHPVPMTYLVEYPTVRQLADAIEGGEPSSSGRIVVPLNSVKGHHQLLLLPGTGGSVMYLTELARDLGGLGFECIGLQALGHDSKGLPRSAIEDIAADNLLTLGVIDPQEVTLIGHSLGSWTGLEMAKQLRDSNQKPPHLIVLDAAAPAERPTDELQGWSDSQWLQSAAENIFATFNLKNPLVDDQLIDRSWDDLISLLHLKMVEMNLLPEGSNSDFVGEIVGAFKSQSQIIYSPPAEKITDISLVRAKQQLASFVNGIPDVFIRDPAWGWFQYAAGNVKIETCEGNHLNMVSKANSASLAGCLKGCIDRFLDK